MAPTRAVVEVEGSGDSSWIFLGWFIFDVDFWNVYFLMSVKGVQLEPLREDKFQKPISTP